MKSETQTPSPRRIWRMKNLPEYTGLPRSTLYDLIKKGKFPKPHKLGPRTVGWDSLEVQAWIDSRLNGSAAQ